MRVVDSVKTGETRAATLRMPKRPRHGFTLVELMVTLAVAAILLGIGVPSFAGAIKNARLSTPWSELRQSLLLARSEAVKGSHVVAVCARASDTACGTDWDDGWLVYIEDPSGTAGTVGSGTVLRISEPVHDEVDVEGTGSNNRTAAGASARAYIRYLASGEADWTNGFFVLCDDRGATHALGLNVALTGDIRSARTAADADAVADVFGREVTCA